MPTRTDFIHSFSAAIAAHQKPCSSAGGSDAADATGGAGTEGRGIRGCSRWHRELGEIFHEFNRVLRPDGYLLVAVIAGTEERYIRDLLGMKTEVYCSLFQEREIECYFKTAGFTVDLIERRNPYDFEIMNERIFALGRKLS